MNRSHSFKTRLSTVATAAFMAVALPQIATASQVSDLMAEADDIEARLVAPIFFNSVSSTDTASLVGNLADLELTLDFPDTGYVSPLSGGAADGGASISTHAVVVKTQTLRNLLITRACAVVDNAAPINGWLSTQLVARRIRGIQNAMQAPVDTYEVTGWVLPVMADNALNEIEAIMDVLSDEGSALDAIGDASISTYAINAAVDDIYYRAKHVCDTYELH